MIFLCCSSVGELCSKTTCIQALSVTTDCNCMYKEIAIPLQCLLWWLQSKFVAAYSFPCSSFDRVHFSSKSLCVCAVRACFTLSLPLKCNSWNYFWQDGLVRFHFLYSSSGWILVSTDFQQKKKTNFLIEIITDGNLNFCFFFHAFRKFVWFFLF